MNKDNLATLHTLTLFWLAHAVLVQQRSIIPVLEYIRDEADRLLKALQ